MRTMLMIALLATVAAPAMAQSDIDQAGRPERGGARAESEQGYRPQRAEPAPRRSREERAERAERRPEREDRPVAVADAPPPPPPPPAIERSAEARPVERSRDDSGQGMRRAGDDVRAWRQRDAGADSVRDFRRGERPAGRPEIDDRSAFDPPASVARDTRSIEQRSMRWPGNGSDAGSGPLGRQVRTTPGFGDRPVRRMGGVTPAEGSAPPPVTREAHRRGYSERAWRTDWRRDRHYDWKRHRARNRFVFHIGFYNDPFGWRYRRHQVGWRMWPDYYASSYWLSDPWMYRLPPAYGPYRWVRYWDDALLVNIYTGQVVDVLHDFFW